MYLRPAIGIGGRSDRHDSAVDVRDRCSYRHMGTYDKPSVLTGTGSEKRTGWAAAGAALELWTRLWFSFLFWNFLPARVIRQQGSFPMLIDKVLSMARGAVVMVGKRGTGRSQRPFFSSNCSWSICFNGDKSIFFSYQIHRLKELQPCEGRRPLQNATDTCRWHFKHFKHSVLQPKQAQVNSYDSRAAKVCVKLHQWTLLCCTTTGC